MMLIINHSNHNDSFSSLQALRHVHRNHTKKCVCKRGDCATCSLNVSKLDTWDQQHRGKSLKEVYGTKCGRELLELVGWRQPLKRSLDTEPGKLTVATNRPKWLRSQTVHNHNDTFKLNILRFSLLQHLERLLARTPRHLLRSGTTSSPRSWKNAQRTRRPKPLSALLNTIGHDFGISKRFFVIWPVNNPQA